ncbi:DUF4178 domain-containing protein [Chryseobacterium sp. D764]|jgi:hypothetical protein|uniref:DUF4178 domain-containing protein n=1 Tax=unclassified Chryseobacterium TaxID=2593645 RepID=UPI001C5793DD|nr:DUF4178 domain-containing protein [Chryseobacterium sp. D764]QXU48514.1 DUF4178 domain-containing protein [Chryseobacterium sp. D764]
MHYVCPACESENKLDLTFPVEEYVCQTCSHLIDVAGNKQIKHLKVPTENVVLDVGQKGKIGGEEYTVVAIIVKRYGNNIFWREYYLKDSKGNDAFLSESDGHWVFLIPMHPDDFKGKNSKLPTYLGRTYRWYENSQCSVEAAAGFFEEHVDFSLATYKEYVNGTRMISQEKTSKKSQYFYGVHISKHDVKKAFKIAHMPYYTGVGIVQPYYFDIKQAINIFCIAALLICLFQLYVYTSRTNETVFAQTINFTDVRDKEMVSSSFTLSGGSAPLKVNAFSGVDNSWANIQLSLVNEKTNEIIYTSKDIEQYHGYEDGESWSEGSQSEDFNLCGVSSGQYHFLISAEKDGSLPAFSGLMSPDSKVTLSRDKSGIIEITDLLSGQTTSFTDGKILEKDTSEVARLTKTSFGTQKLDSLISAEAPKLTTDPISSNTYVQLKATWLPVSFWNFGFIIFIMAALFIAMWIGKHFFNVNKWKNSSNSPYSAS